MSMGGTAALCDLLDGKPLALGPAYKECMEGGRGSQSLVSILLKRVGCEAESSTLFQRILGLGLLPDSCTAGPSS